MVPFGSVQAIRENAAHLRFVSRVNTRALEHIKRKNVLYASIVQEAELLRGN